MSDAIDEFCSARNQEDVVCISATLAQKACKADSISVVLAGGEQFHYCPGSKRGALAQPARSKVITRMAAWALESGQTAVVRDDRTRSSRAA